LLKKAFNLSDFCLSCISLDTVGSPHLKVVCDVYVADTPDTDEGKLPETAVADEWDVTSPPIEQRPADASTALASPEKKKKPRIRGMGNRQLSACYSMRNVD